MQIISDGTLKSAFGRYLEECIRSISTAEKTQAVERNEPVALIICSNPYRRQIEEHLTKVGLIAAKQKVQRAEREKALQILSEDGESNLGWRIMLACGREYVARSLIRKAFEEDRPLIELFTTTERDAILAEAEAWAQKNESTDFADEAHEVIESVAVTSYEGSKGRSEFIAWIDPKRFSEKKIDAGYWKK